MASYSPNDGSQQEDQNSKFQTHHDPTPFKIYEKFKKGPFKLL